MKKLYDEENVKNIANSIREKHNVQGYNLIQYYDLSKRTIAGVNTEISNNNIILNGTASSSTNTKISNLNFTLKANTPYTFVSFVKKISSSAQGAFLIGTDAVTNKISLPYQQEINVKNITLTEDFNFNRLSLYMGGAGIVLDLTAQIMLLEGTYSIANIPAYEPYMKIKLSEMPQAILDIPKGIDTSDATAVSDDILLGRTAYARGQQLVGTYEPVSSDYNVQLIVPATRTASANDYFFTRNIKSIDLSKIDTSKWTSVAYMFWYCFNISSLDLSKFNTEKVTTMERMFNSCSKITELDLSSFYTPNLTNTKYMFNECNQLTKIDMRNMNFDKVTSYSTMFGDSYSTVTRVPYTCEIIVNQSGYDFITSKFPNYTNLKLVEGGA